MNRPLRNVLPLLGVGLLSFGVADAQAVQGSSLAGGGTSAPGGPQGKPATLVQVQLAGNPLREAPWFEYVRAFPEGGTVRMALDPGRLPSLLGVTANVYVVAAKTRREWRQDPGLLDVAGGPRPMTFAAGSIRDNVLVLDGGTLSGDAGASIGVGYDVVIDVDASEDLSDGDVIDGYGEKAGFYVVHDVTLPGPYDVTEIVYSGGNWLGQKTYFPTDIASMGKLPLVVISHGNGHNYLWYDHIGDHLASYGYVVMSHQNRTGPGIETASVTTLTNTDYILVNQDTIGGGVLDGHLDSHNIVWIGHSRGGEGVTRAYDAIYDGTTTLNTAYGLEDIKLISSIAPTDFLGATRSNPHRATYSLWTGGADADVNGCANCDICQTFHLFDRAEAERMSISLHGVGHGDFHDGGGGSVATGPCRVGRANTHVIMLGYLLPLVEHYIKGNVPAKDFLWRQYESFHPIGAPLDSECVVVDLMFEEEEGPGKFVIDDFQTNPSPHLSSSGGLVEYDVASLLEDRLDDGNGNFSDQPTTDPMNGMTHAGPTDTGRGIVFEFGGRNTKIAFDIVPEARDFSRYHFLSFRATQATRHALTTAVLGDAVFSVVLGDGSGGMSFINLGAYGGGIEEPYQRTQCGTGAGWANEWETIRIRLTDFQHDETLDLTDIVTVGFLFGHSYGSPFGRLGLDEIELTRD